MKYNLILENYLKGLTSLQKIRVKTDPKFLQQKGLPDKCPSYEGYILEEGLTKIKILILPPDLSVEEVPIDLIEYIAEEEKESAFNDLKQFLIKHLSIKEENPLIQHIISSTCLDDLETFLKQSGLSSEQIMELYGQFITT